MHGADKCQLRDPQARQSVKIIQDVCQLCSKTGHNAKSCRANKFNNQNKLLVVCQWCEKTGHTANNCWKKENKNSSKLVRQICNMLATQKTVDLV